MLNKVDCIREGFKKKILKKVENSTLGPDPPPLEVEKI